MNIQKLNLLKSLGTFGKAAKTYIIVNSPSLLTGVGIAGVVGTSIAASIATVKTVDTLREMPSATTSEKLTATWTNYIPTVAIGAMTIACIYGSNRENGKRIAALASAYSLSEEHLKGYVDKAKDVVGPTKARDIDRAVAQESYNKAPNTNVVIETGHGETLFYDEYSGRKFKADRLFLENCILKANQDLLSYKDNGGLYFVTLNDVYVMWNLEEAKCGEEVGWNSYASLVRVAFTPVYDDDGVTVVQHIRFEDLEPTFEDPRH